ncbi:MAG: hypothetical protein ACU84J_06240, partial [Gammaproteobacteria bacterium]
MANNEKQVRAARDNLIDLLGFGLTYPLTDAGIAGGKIIVPFETEAKIAIECSQKNVVYQLRGKDGEILAGGPFEIQGDGEQVLLTSAPILDNTTFTVHARKSHHPDRYTAFLEGEAVIEVGLDLTLPARIVEAELLEPTEGAVADDAPRLVFYGNSVEIAVDESQEGVDYHPLYVKPDGTEAALLPPGTPPTRGNRGQIVLVTVALHDDIDIRIRATKVFESSNRQNQSDLLTIVLPLKVRADTAAALTLRSGPIVAYRAAATVAAATSQVAVR